MPHAPRESMLRATTLALWAGAAATVAAAVWLPYRVPSSEAGGGRVRAVAPATGTASDVSFDDLLDVNLRRPLVDAPVATTGPATPAGPAGPGIRLAGVVVEPGHSYAVLVTAGGATEVRSVGERAGGAEVLSISASTVTIRLAGQISTLRLPPSAAGMR